jgi:endonuclease YncB( thermonuclease family)
MRAFLTLWLILCAVPGNAADMTVPGGLTRAGAPGVVVEIIDGDTLKLRDGREVRLVGLQAPKLPLGRRGFKAWPLAQEAKQALADLTLQKTVTLHFGGRRKDRHGRVLAHLSGTTGVWVQGALLTRGMARVYSFRDNRAAVRTMLELEGRARRQRRGIWRHPFYRVRRDTDAGSDIGTFQLVEGHVRAIATVRDRTYLNFGSDWRRDFTVTVRKRFQRLFEGADYSLASLKGRRIRVRGWLDSRNGPMIEATHPEQIEIVDTPR